MASSSVDSIVILKIVAKTSIELNSDPMRTPAIMPMRLKVAPSAVGFIRNVKREPPLMTAAIIDPMMPQTIHHRNIMKPFLIAKPQDTIFITERMVVIP